MLLSDSEQVNPDEGYNWSWIKDEDYWHFQMMCKPNVFMYFLFEKSRKLEIINI